MNDIKTYLSNFLDVINYSDNKEEFINKILITIYLEAVNESIKSLTSEKQTELEEKLKDATTPENLQEFVKNNLDQNLFQQSIRKSSQAVFSDYIQTIDSTLSEEQKTKLQQYFSSINPQPTQ